MRASTNENEIGESVVARYDGACKTTAIGFEKKPIPVSFVRRVVTRDRDPADEGV